MTADRLSALDASFLAVESPIAPMHVGWVSSFDAPEGGPRPGFPELFEHLAARLELAPRYRQKLAGVPLGLHEPMWVDDPDFDAADHLLHAEGEDLDALADAIFSTPLPRDRPLWQMWIADGLPDGRIAMIGKMHHCMVDGAAVVELGNLILDAEPDATDRAGDGEWTAVPEPRRAPGLRAQSPTAPSTAPRSPSRLSGSPGRPRAGARSPGSRAGAHARCRRRCSRPRPAPRSTAPARRGATTSA